MNTNDLFQVIVPKIPDLMGRWVQVQVVETKKYCLIGKLVKLEELRNGAIVGTEMSDEEDVGPEVEGGAIPRGRVENRDANSTRDLKNGAIPNGGVGNSIVGKNAIRGTGLRNGYVGKGDGVENGLIHPIFHAGNENPGNSSLRGGGSLGESVISNGLPSGEKRNEFDCDGKKKGQNGNIKGQTGRLAAQNDNVSRNGLSVSNGDGSVCTGNVSVQNVHNGSFSVQNCDGSVKNEALSVHVGDTSVRNEGLSVPKIVSKRQTYDSGGRMNVHSHEDVLDNEFIENFLRGGCCRDGGGNGESKSSGDGCCNDGDNTCETSGGECCGNVEAYYPGNEIVGNSESKKDNFIDEPNNNEENENSRTENNNSTYEKLKNSQKEKHNPCCDGENTKNSTSHFDEFPNEIGNSSEENGDLQNLEKNPFDCARNDCCRGSKKGENDEAMCNNNNEDDFENENRISESLETANKLTRRKTGNTDTRKNTDTVSKNNGNIESKGILTSVGKSKKNGANDVKFNRQDIVGNSFNERSGNVGVKKVRFIMNSKPPDELRVNSSSWISQIEANLGRILCVLIFVFLVNFFVLK